MGSRKTIQEVNTFRQAANVFLQQTKEESHTKYALRKMLKRTEKLAEDANESMQDIRVELASVNKEGNLLITAQNNYEYTPAKMKELNSKLRAIQKNEVEVEPYITKDHVSTIDHRFVDVFRGFIFEEEEIEPEGKGEKLKEVPKNTEVTNGQPKEEKESVA